MSDHEARLSLRWTVKVTPVTLGHSSLARVVIEKGLEAGDRIALRDPTRGTDEILGTGGKERARKEGAGSASANQAN